MQESKKACFSFVICKMGLEMDLEIVKSFDCILGVKFYRNLNFGDCINPLAHKLALLINIFQNVWGARSAGPWTTRQDRCGVFPLLHDCQLQSDSRRKAEILNQQFCSVFTDEYTTNMPKLEVPPTSDMDNIEITQSGITRLLSELNSDKAPEPVELPNLLLKKCCQGDISFFEHSIQTRVLTHEWVEANVAPVFKKGDRHTASNYRPISLTCVRAKLLEHIIFKNIMTHITNNKILNPVQHCFRAEHSCKSQILLTTEDLVQNYEDKIQTDLIVLDFSIAFDAVPHQRLLHKLDHYGIRGPTLLWIQNFLTPWTQKVVAFRILLM